MPSTYLASPRNSQSHHGAAIIEEFGMRWIELPNEKHRKIENIVIKSFSHDTLGSIGHKILPVQGNQKNTFDPFYQLLQRASSCRNSLGWLVSPVSRSQKEGSLDNTEALLDYTMSSQVPEKRVGDPDYTMRGGG